MREIPAVQFNVSRGYPYINWMRPAGLPITNGIFLRFKYKNGLKKIENKVTLPPGQANSAGVFISKITLPVMKSKTPGHIGPKTGLVDETVSDSLTQGLPMPFKAVRLTWTLIPNSITEGELLQIMSTLRSLETGSTVGAPNTIVPFPPIWALRLIAPIINNNTIASVCVCDTNRAKKLECFIKKQKCLSEKGVWIGAVLFGQIMICEAKVIRF